MKKHTAIVGFFISFLAGMGLLWGINRGSAGSGHATAETGSAESARKVNAGAVKVDLFVMSQCPYGVQAVNGFKDAVAGLGADLDLHVNYIGQTSPNGDLTAMHGPNEVAGNMAQVCAMQYSAKWFDFILCQNKNYKDVASNWVACGEEVGIPADKMKSCMEGTQGKELLATSYKKAQEAGARGSPTILLNGAKYEGGRKPTDFFRAVCNAYGEKKPAACNSIPEAPKVNVTVVSDKRCAECDTKRMMGQIQQKVGNPVVKTLDYSDAEGKKLVDAAKPVNLPAIFFDSTLDADKDATQAFARGLKPAGDFKVMAMGGWNPVCADDGGCNLDECKPTMQCRPEEPNKLEVFVMSECPFGVRGLDAMKEVIDNFKKNDAKVDFQIHFIGDGDASKLTSMHGQSEVDEDIREICAINKYAKDYKYMDYIWCRNKNIKDKNWQSCTGGSTGIDTDVMQKCFDGEGKELLAKSFAYSKATGMSASPTWLANNKFKFSGVDAETIKTNVCSHNKLGGCDAKLSGPPAPAGGAKGAAAAAPGCGG